MSWSCFLEVVAAVRPLVELFAIGAGGVAAVWGLLKYRQSVGLEKAKWMKELYDKFYERAELKTTREILDGNDAQKVLEIVQSEDPRFTDYLNFFEFLGYLSESKQIGRDEVIGMFDYYLQNLRSHQVVMEYISKPEKGFEKLRALLEKV